MAYRDDPQVQTMLANLPEKTGKSIAQWFEVLAASKIEKHGEMLKLLKTEHGMTHGFANTVALIYREESAAAPPPAGDDLVAVQYAGGKAGLRPIYDKLVAAALAFGPDVEVAPKKANVSLRRKKQFALVQPSTKDRMDLGLNLKGTEPSGRLEGGDIWGGMCSHRIRLGGVDDVDAEVLGWLKQAYERAG